MKCLWILWFEVVGLVFVELEMIVVFDNVVGFVVMLVLGCGVGLVCGLFVVDVLCDGWFVEFCMIVILIYYNFYVIWLCEWYVCVKLLIDVIGVLVM